MSGSFLQGQRQNLSHLVQVLDVVVDRESLGQRAVLWVVPAAQNTGVIAPRISLVRESPTIRTSSGAMGPTWLNTARKKSGLGFSAPTCSEMNTPSNSRMSPDLSSFRCWATAVPLVTAYCLTWPFRSLTSS